MNPVVGPAFFFARFKMLLFGVAEVALVAKGCPPASASRVFTLGIQRSSIRTKMQSMRETLHTPASNHEHELLKSLGLPTSRSLARRLHLCFSVRSHTSNSQI